MEDNQISVEQAAEEVLENFCKEYREKIKQAQNSGALSGDEKPFLVAKAVVQIAAKQFDVDWLSDYRSTLKNLRCSI